MLQLDLLDQQSEKEDCYVNLIWKLLARGMRRTESVYFLKGFHLIITTFCFWLH